MRMRLMLALALALLLAACGATSDDVATSTTGADGAGEQVTATIAAPDPTETPPAPTATSEPTSTPEPTATATLTPTPEPTNTPAPTATPEPTNTPAPPATPEPTSTPTPQPTPTMTTDEAKAQYRGDIDIREIDKNVDGYYDWKLTYAGEVLTIQQDGERTLVQVQVTYPGGSDFDRVTIVVLYDDSHAGDGIYEDDYVTIWGRPITMFEFTNAFGGTVSQPLFTGDFIEKR